MRRLRSPEMRQPRHAGIAPPARRHAPPIGAPARPVAVAQRRRGRCCGSASTGGAPSVVIARGAARALAARVAPARSTPHSRQDDDADVDGLRHVRRAGVLPLRAAHERGECGGGRSERPCMASAGWRRTRAAGVRTKAKGAWGSRCTVPTCRRPPRYGMVSVRVPLESLRGRRGAQ